MDLYAAGSGQRHQWLGGRVLLVAVGAWALPHLRSALVLRTGGLSTRPSSRDPEVLVVPGRRSTDAQRPQLAYGRGYADVHYHAAPGLWAPRSDPLHDVQAHGVRSRRLRDSQVPLLRVRLRQIHTSGHRVDAPPRLPGGLRSVAPITSFGACVRAISGLASPDSREEAHAHTSKPK